MGEIEAGIARGDRSIGFVVVWSLDVGFASLGWSYAG